MAELLTDAEVEKGLTDLDGWNAEGKTIKTTKTFDGFVSAVEFVNKLVEPAEAAGHHPDLEISYNKVTITLTSHDAGGLTEKDFEMAKTISKI
jgi:4a-hydroxytetrahydrobiopterin dehydratase